MLGGCTSTTPSFYYQAYDEQWDDPFINPAFVNEADAVDYVERNNMESSHGYEVRVINYRYEVRHQTELVNHLLFTTHSLSDAKSYMKEYEDMHNLFIYDLLETKQIK